MYKKFKKRLYLALARTVGLYANAQWHVTSLDEVKVMERIRLGKGRIFLARDLPGKLEDFHPGPVKRPGELELLFLARIHPIKGLDRLLLWMVNVPGKIHLNVVGPEIDENYAKECRALARLLPEGTSVSWIGAVGPESVLGFFQSAHLYVLPTRTENHGYTIQEALACGCPVLTSDGTPWKDLEVDMAGWCFPLDHPREWIQQMNQMVAMDDPEYQKIREKARAKGERSIAAEGVIEETLTMFNAVTKRGRTQ
jgi:glycosyltransferase involved in cell wall biosynthesis